MSDSTKFDYTPQEVRDALAWQMRKTGLATESVIEEALKPLTDEEIQKRSDQTIEFNVDAQLMVTQLREAQRRGQVD